MKPLPPILTQGADGELHEQHVVGSPDCPPCAQHRSPARSEHPVVRQRYEHPEFFAPAHSEVGGLLARAKKLCPPDDVEMRPPSPYKPFVDLIRDLAAALRREGEQHQWWERNATWWHDTCEQAWKERDGYAKQVDALRSLSVQPTTLAHRIGNDEQHDGPHCSKCVEEVMRLHSVHRLPTRKMPIHLIVKNLRSALLDPQRTKPS